MLYYISMKIAFAVSCTFILFSSQENFPFYILLCLEIIGKKTILYNL